MRLFALFIVVLHFAYPSAATADLNRKDAVEKITGVIADYGSTELSARLQGTPLGEDAAVNVGDQLVFELSSSGPSYYLMVFVDPKGDVAAVFPDHLVSGTPKAYRSFIYPPEETGVLRQGEPVGVQTVFVFASDSVVALSDFEYTDESDVYSVGNNASAIDNFVSRVNTVLAGSEVKATQLRYFVDSDVQFNTRAVRRELKKRIEQVNLLAESAEGNAGSDRHSTSTSVAGIQSDALAVNDIRFETSSNTLTQVGRAQLDVFGNELLSVLDENPNVSVFLEGHTDSSGPSDYNQALSERRAKSAKQYLADEFGIPNDRLIASGSGENRPLASNIDPDSMALNRRVEIRLGTTAGN